MYSAYGNKVFVFFNPPAKVDSKKNFLIKKNFFDSKSFFRDVFLGFSAPENMDFVPKAGFLPGKFDF